MGCALDGHFRRLYPTSSARMSAMDMAKYALPVAEYRELLKLRNDLDQETSSSSSSSSRGDGKRNDVPIAGEHKSPLAPLMKELYTLMVAGYLFEQNTRCTTWFEHYYLSPIDFPRRHERLVESKRWGRPRRPIVVMLLGRHAVVTHDQRLFWCVDTEDAYLTWLTLVHTEHDGLLEDRRACPHLHM